ncbi:MAG: DUF4340 domain-containing protein [Phycisphaerales bacterium JB039]
MTVAAILAAATVTMLSGRGGGGEALPERIVPGLEDRINDVARITLVQGEERLELSRDQGEWVVASKGGYPARFEPVKELIIGVANLAPRERKTANPQLHQRLGLGAPGEDDEATGVTLLDDSGAEIASVVLGKSTSGAGAGRFVRVAGAEQTWLAAADVNVRLDPMTWMERELVRLDRARVARVTIDHPGAAPLELVRDDAGQFAPVDLPPDRQAKSSELSQVAGAASYIGMSDVRKADAPPPDGAVVTMFEAEDGMTLAITTWSEGDDWWASFEVTSPEGAGDAPQPEPDDAAAADAGAEPAAEEPAAGESPDPAAEAAALRDKLAGWAFKIEPFKATQLRKALDELTEAAEPAGEGPVIGPPGPAQPEEPLGPVLPPAGGGR